MTAEETIANIELATVAGHNLRALLLRLADGERIRDRTNADVAACVDAEPRGLIETTFSPALTPLGREVAERLRPEPWRTKAHRFLADSKDSYIVEQPGGRSLGLCWKEPDAERIAALLTADDLRAAKTYRTEPDR